MQFFSQTKKQLKKQQKHWVITRTQRKENKEGISCFSNIRPILPRKAKLDIKEINKLLHSLKRLIFVMGKKFISKIIGWIFQPLYVYFIDKLKNL